MLLVALVIVSLVTGTHLTPLARMPWYEHVATGLPAFEHGRWWTVATAPLFVTHPLRFLIALPLTGFAVGWAEFRFGTLRTIGLFVAGHLIGVLGAVAAIALFSARGDAWAVGVAHELGAGPTAGALACLVFAAATLPSPWRLRVRFAIGAWVVIRLVYLGHLTNVEHAVVFAVAMLVSGFLPAYRHPAGRPTLREWRLLGFAWLVVIGIVEVFDLIPFNGPIGENIPFLPVVDVLIDLVVIAIVAQGVRLGMRAAWVATIVLACVNIMFVLVLEDLFENPRELMSVALPSAVLWAAQLAIMLFGRGAFRARFRRSRRVLGLRPADPETAKACLKEFGGGSTSWMTTWADNQQIKTGSGVIAVQVHAGVALMLGDPVVPQEKFGNTLAEFSNAAEHAGLVPCVFSAGQASADARPSGWRQAVIAEDTIVDLRELSFSGKRWNSVRTSLNKAEREGIAFRLCRLADEPRSVISQVRTISEQWAGDRGLPEMRFTLGTIEEALDPEVLVGFAVDRSGALHGITSWLPVYSGDGTVRGWTLDLMRRRDGGFGPVMEFLIGKSALEFARQGVDFLSLSGAPLVRPEHLEATPVERVLDRVGDLVEPLYGFQSLHRFKQKFNPRSESLYMLYRDEGDLPRIAIALTRAYLPDASLRDLLMSASEARTK